MAMFSVTRSLPFIAAIVLWAVLLTGCGPSVWEREFQPAATPTVAAISADSLPADSPVTVREASWGRLMEFRINLAERIRESNMHGADWLAANRDVYTAGIIRVLQITEPADRVTLLGSSDFRSVDRLDGNDSRLEEFGRSIGANRVFWAFSLTQARAKQQSINDQVFGADSGQFDRRLNNRGLGTADFSTPFTPMAVQRNETAWLVYYLRIQ